MTHVWHFALFTVLIATAPACSKSDTANAPPSPTPERTELSATFFAPGLAMAADSYGVAADTASRMSSDWRGTGDLVNIPAQQVNLRDSVRKADREARSSFKQVPPEVNEALNVARSAVRRATTVLGAFAADVGKVQKPSGDIANADLRAVQRAHPEVAPALDAESNALRAAWRKLASWATSHSADARR
jgi:hypothetical protein